MTKVIATSLHKEDALHLSQISRREITEIKIARREISKILQNILFFILLFPKANTTLIFVFVSKNLTVHNNRSYKLINSKKYFRDMKHHNKG